MIPFTVWNAFVEETVAHCLDLEYDDFAILLLPNEGSTLPPVIAKDPRVRIVEAGTHRMSVKRNQAFRSFPADLYACIDSDAYPEPDWLAAAARIAMDVPDAWILSGPNVSPEARGWRTRAVSHALKSPLVGASRAYMKRLGEKDRYVTDVWTCNAFLRREVFTELGGFDEELYTAEDTELARRVRLAGRRCDYSDSIRVFHHNRPLFAPFLKQKFVAGYGALPYIRKHPGLHVLFCFAPLLALALFLLGGLTALLPGPWFLLWLLGVGAYAATVLFESFRRSPSIGEAPGTALAIVLGNLVPGIGLLLALLGIPVRTHRIYSNFQSQHASREAP